MLSVWVEFGDINLGRILLNPERGRSEVSGGSTESFYYKGFACGSRECFGSQRGSGLIKSGRRNKCENSLQVLPFAKNAQALLIVAYALLAVLFALHKKTWPVSLYYIGCFVKDTGVFALAFLTKWFN